MRLRSLWQRPSGPGAAGNDELPLRAELFSSGQMREHGRAMAAAHVLARGRASNRLLARLADNERVLLVAFSLLGGALSRSRGIAPAGEWLLDNFHLIEAQVRTARRHLPGSYSRGLPSLADGPSAGLPRVYDIALQAIAHGDGRVDPESLGGFVAAYQGVSALTLGELWAIPIMLRLALLENLRRVASRLADDRVGRDLADEWADRMVSAVATDPKSLILVVADMARSGLPPTGSFVAELARRLQGQGRALALPLTWIEQWLADSGLTIAQSVSTENQQQAADQVSMSNSIGSLRFLEATDWREFVETLSVVEQTLREDPGGVYGRMDFATRDDYRHEVERIAKAGALSEGRVARLAVDLAQAQQAAGSEDPRRRHVGFHLLGAGLPGLEHAAGVLHPVSGRIARACRRGALPLYLGAIALISAACTTGFVALAFANGARAWPLTALGLLALLCASQLALSLVNLAVGLMVAPRRVPRMDFSLGIPPESRTLVAIPSMLSGAEAVARLIDALEVRYLANRDAHLHFCLLTDLTDAPAESMPADAPLVEIARAGIERLNARYPGARGDVFHLFHRARRWNARDAVWMGHERKRGKLAALNALLRSGPGERFALVVGDTGALTNVRYVITLDTDTQLPRESARVLVAAMAHPLNRPRHDPVSGCVVEGYGILQPRVASSLTGANRSRYAGLIGGEAGIDPYTRAVSDTYQDLFGEGSFIGKGIYDVDAFERALGGRFPDNRILSHDLIEGAHARSGFISDVLLFEDEPDSYAADATRRARWIRGDWQLLRWLAPGVPDAAGRRVDNPLSALSRWKLFDNLRRSLVPAGLTLLLLIGWGMPGLALMCTTAVLGVLALPAALGLLPSLLRRSRDTSLSDRLADWAGEAGRAAQRVGFSLACLPQEAWTHAVAIVRTLWRLTLTRTGLLEWTASAQAGPDRSAGQGNLAGAILAMRSTLLVAAAAMVVLAVLRPAALVVAAPLLALWFAAPLMVWWTARPRAPRMARLEGGDIAFLRRAARRTWAYFDNFVGPEDNWLPPDNNQEQSAVGVAHRTSPTNMGLGLLANLAAFDFGYLPAGCAIERIARAFDAMAALERYRGHFFNWYDTRSLKPLAPAYVSTVDSGNLAGHLLTLRAGLAELAERPIVEPRCFKGLADTLEVLAAAVVGPAPLEIAALRGTLAGAIAANPSAPGPLRTWLDRVAASAATLPDALAGAGEALARSWAEALARDCAVLRSEMDRFASGATQSAPTLRELAAMEDGSGAPDSPPARARERLATLDRLLRQAGAFATMDYGFLYDPGRHLLSIGYDVGARRRDAGSYDLLASEARLGVFVAIALDQLPQESWFALGRTLTRAGNDAVLMSWSGSMFEYLMPLLVMPSYQGSLLAATCEAAVRAQIDYGLRRAIPWGVSESGYNAVDAQRNYQYRAFGVPGLGLKRGLGEDLVVAPYASVLALMIAPQDAAINLRRLTDLGLSSRYGFHEAIDYTPARVPRGQAGIVVRSVMAHHAGMSLLAFAQVLLDRPMQRRFEADPQLRAATMLLQERVPRERASTLHADAPGEAREAPAVLAASARVFTDPNTRSPEVQLLSNGRYHVMLTQAGGGISRWKDLAVTRWREDATRDQWGSFCYLRDLDSGQVWSIAHQPVGRAAERYEAIFTEARVEFHRRDGTLETRTEIAVSPEDDIELRRVTLTNRARVVRTIEATSYAEVVLAPAAADALHPAFSNLFVQTEVVAARQAILCTRRPRSQGDAAPWMLHQMALQGAALVEVSYETDRMRFLGRGHDAAAPRALDAPGPLSGSAGSVLDPVVAIRCRIVLAPEQTATFNLVTGVAETREAALALADKYQEPRLAERVFELAWTHSQVVLRQINASAADAQLYARMAGSIVHASASLRAEPEVLCKNRRGQSGLWGHAISGDLPIVLVKIGDAANIDLVRQLVCAHAYWRLKGLSVDLVFWNEDHTGYRQVLNDQILGLIAAGDEASAIDRPGGIFVRPAEQLSDEDRLLLESSARVVLSDARGSLAEQFDRPADARPPAARLVPVRTWRRGLQGAMPALRRDLLFFNGLGGFTADGREYVITTGPGQSTPAPWVNVLANEHFGTVISESGSAYTWSENAHAFRLTPWHNDPVGDAGGEAFYLRDEESGHFWSPMPLPARGADSYTTRHGFGYSVFEHSEAGIVTETWVYVAPDAALKFTAIRVRNDSGRRQRMTATGVVEWVLGDLRSRMAPQVVSEIDVESGVLLARNAYGQEFAERVAFFDAGQAPHGVSGDRCEFIGRHGSLANPAAMHALALGGRVGAGLDPCGALQVSFELAPGEEREVVFVLGAGRDTADAIALARASRGTAVARAVLASVWRHWNHTLGALQVETPDPMLDVLVNGWLPYQTLACRLWAKSGGYQSGGAFGFRDQLQDAMALVHIDPTLLRRHVLLCASRQFREGDVQHWWHPPAGRGVRTHCSDDYLWLVVATCRYVNATADASVLEEMVGFLEGRPVGTETDSYYDLPGQAAESQTLYAHCVRAIVRGLDFGTHGLPLMGSGDWNDGMNLVGAGGRGESVWLGFFLFDALTRFADLAAARGDAHFQARCLAEAERLRAALDAHGWDGEWYRRAYFDDGTPLGTAAAAECRIDSVAQSWSVLSGAGVPERARAAMDALDRHLVRRSERLVQLLDPPFDRSDLN
ncbi:MAG: GH36-type glycosyl hydrolase domain-containing protein, partial [Burkholderiales bacterium]